MRLKRMEIHGFKSFCDRARFDFPPGITAIVGPNGCGKSNVVDALRWAMGEQSVKQLRGKSMEDVIFAGTAGKAALNLAEVSLTLVNDGGGDAPEGLRDFSEIMLTRRLFRSGESVYLINRQPCRLKDVTNVFLGSGVGARSYAVIQQGNIGAITDAGPEERRLYIEEAAGITRYKERKRETLRKLEATDQNLLRVQDIVAEVDRQMKGLQRQARKAEKYKTFRARIRDLDVRLALEETEAFALEIGALRFRIDELREQGVVLAIRRRRLERSAAGVRQARDRKAETIAARKNARLGLERKIDRAEADAAHAKEEAERLDREAEGLRRKRAELTERSREMAAEVADGESRLAELREAVEAGAVELSRERSEGDAVRKRQAEANAALEEARKARNRLENEAARLRNLRESAAAAREKLQGRLRRLEEDAALAERKQGALETEVAEAKSAAESAVAEVAESETRFQAAGKAVAARREALRSAASAAREAESRRNAVRSDHAALKRMADSLEWYRDGVRAVLGRKESQGRVLGLVADLLEPEAGFAPAVEAALGDALQYIVVPDTAAAREAIDFLQTENAGRGGFLPLTHLTPPASGGNGDGRLLDHVAVRPGFEPVAEALLGPVGVAENLAAAEARRNGGRPMVTPAGELFSRRGVMIGGSADRLDGILAKKQELKQLAAALAEREGRLTAAREAREEAEAELAQAEADRAAAEEARNQASQAELAAQKRLYRAEESLAAGRRDAQRVESRRDELQAELEEAEDQVAAREGEAAQIDEQLETSRGGEVEAAATAQSAAEAAAALDDRLMERRVAQTARQTERDNLEKSLERLRRFQTEGAERLEGIGHDIEDRETRRNQVLETASAAEAGLADLRTALEAATAAVQEAETEREGIERELRDVEAALESIRSRREAADADGRSLTVDLQGLEMRRENVENRIAERYHRVLAAFAEERDQLAGGDLSPSAIARELETLREKLARLGDVNLSAISEYEALQERAEFLETQRADLAEAVADLHKVIRKINRVSQERFLETFNQVNEKLKEVFPRLFEGGDARLELTEPNQPLESGVEFLVSPPGKRLTRMTLLSGGEKAMSAIAFVFSIFLIKPAAFCILDEIDAPLDEANVYRFNKLLKLIGEKSQIIMITHKRRSMEFADILFGVTMEKKGISRVVSVDLEESRALAEDDSPDDGGEESAVQRSEVGEDEGSGRGAGDENAPSPNPEEKSNTHSAVSARGPARHS